MVTQAVVLDHVAVSVPDARVAAAFVGGRLGAVPHSSGPGFGFRWWQWTLVDGARLEILEPEGPPDGFLHRFLERRGGAGVHHVTFKVPRLEDAVARARENGFEVVGESELGPSWKEAFLHPKSAQGVVVQLAETHSELVPENVPRYPFEGLPNETPEPLGFAGLRLVADSAERAQRLWEATLGGRCTETDGIVSFRWPDSPLRIAVEIDPSRAAGPIGLEFVANRAVPDTTDVLGIGALSV